MAGYLYFTPLMKVSITIMNKLIPVLLVCFGVSACKTPAASVVKNTETVYRPAQQDIASGSLQQKGVDFVANGTMPANWQLEINVDDTVRFTADDGLAIKFAYHRLAKDMNAERSIYSTKIPGGDVTIIIVEKECTAAATNTVYSKQVTFTFNSRAYTGCGRYLADINLEGKWLLEKISYTTIRPEEYNRVPFFQFDLTKQRITGNDGCNTIGTQIEVQGNRIKFSAMMSTEMACVKKSIERIISLQVSSQLVNYYFKGGKLYLYLPDDSLLVFKKG